MFAPERVSGPVTLDRGCLRKDTTPRECRGWDVVPAQVLWESQAAGSGPRNCAFSHWDPQGVIDPYVLHYLAQLRDAGFALHLVTASSRLHPESLQAAREFCVSICSRENKGLDFASWKSLLLRYPGLRDSETLLLANDSFFGPVRGSLERMLAVMESGPFDFWGCTEDVAGLPHLQSYFLCLKQAALRHERFSGFFRAVRALESKDDIIREYETKFTCHLAQGGLRPGVFISRRCLPTPKLSPYVWYWDDIMARFGYPFLKRVVFAGSRYRRPDVSAWKKALDGVYDVSLIEDYYKRIGP